MCVNSCSLIASAVGRPGQVLVLPSALPSLSHHPLRLHHLRSLALLEVKLSKRVLHLLQAPVGLKLPKRALTFHCLPEVELSKRVLLPHCLMMRTPLHLREPKFCLGSVLRLQLPTLCPVTSSPFMTNTPFPSKIGMLVPFGWLMYDPVGEKITEKPFFTILLTLAKGRCTSTTSAEMPAGTSPNFMLSAFIPFGTTFCLVAKEYSSLCRLQGGMALPSAVPSFGARKALLSNASWLHVHSRVLTLCSSSYPSSSASSFHIS